MMTKLLLTITAIIGFSVNAFSQVGFTCANAIPVTALPYQVSDNTANYGDTFDNAQGLLCGATPSGTNYFAGNDVFYSYTAMATGNVNIKLTPHVNGEGSGIFVYQGCGNVGLICMAGVGNTSSSPRELNLLMFAGETYTLAVSSSSPVQTFGYDLLIQEEFCTPKPANFTVLNITSNSAILNWSNPSNTFSSWQVAVQETGTGMPSGAGETVNSKPFTKTGLTAATAYEFWVRAECSPGSGIFTAWGGPHTFTTSNCANVDKCTYKFRVTDTGGDSWNGAQMQVKQNGTVITTISPTFSITGFYDYSVQLCKDLPFELIWITAGTAPQECGVAVLNPFAQTVYIKAPGDGNPGDTLFTEIVNCNGPVCTSTPNGIVVSNINGNGATINWNSNNTSWDVFLTTEQFSSVDQQTVPTFSNVQKPFLMATELIEEGVYYIRVRSSCSDYLKSSWSSAVPFTVPILCPKPTQIAVDNISVSGATINWTSNSNLGDVYLTTDPDFVPNQQTVPTFSNILKPFVMSTPLLEEGIYYVHVRSLCPETLKSSWSQSGAFEVPIQCPKPTNLQVENLTTTSAKLLWTYGTNGDSSWEILLLYASNGITPEYPEVNPVVAEGSFLLPVSGNTNFLTVNQLQQASVYYYYIRTLCADGSKSAWSEPLVFNTVICAPEDKCIYKFILTDSGNNGWNQARLQVRQNGAVIATLGQTFNSGPGPITINVGLCNNVPFDLYWSVAGEQPDEIGVAIQNPFTDIIFTKLPGEGTPGSVLYSNSQLGNCIPPTCPKPTNLTIVANTTTATSVELAWTEVGAANQWEIYVAATGSALPINGSPLSGIAPYYFSNNPNFNVTGLNPATSYTYYVRSICSPTDIGTWTILNPKSFLTKPINDECVAAINIPVNAAGGCDLYVSGNTLGGTASVADNSCAGTENDDVWFSFTAINTLHIISIINVQGNTTDLNHTVFSGTECGNLVPILCSNPNTSIHNNLTIGNLYFVRVYTNLNNVNNSATFDICISTPPPILNDECTNAIAVPISDFISSPIVVSATLTGASASDLPNNCAGVANDDVWYEFVASGPKHLIQFSNVEGTAVNLNYSLWASADCTNLQFLHCGTTSGGFAENLTVGVTYKIRVWSTSEVSQHITFDLSIINIYPPLLASTTQFTTEQLVTNVLVNNPCVTLSNITSSTGTNFGSVNGIGYFTNPNMNPLIPINSGIILSTGNAASAGGPNTSVLGDTGGAWLNANDPDLEAIVFAATGQTMASKNTTKLEFDFTSQNEFMSFNFLFASEEYGTFQCDFADAFAFLLTDLTTGITTNLAVVPGTNTPVSVVTIRDNAFNTNCVSVNQSFFDTYFSTGILAQNAPTNFNGQTALMSASTSIIPNNPYHIKMVIADRSDGAFDSAVFIQAGSFSSGPPQCTDKIRLISFVDHNNNGIKDSDEAEFTYGNFVYELNSGTPVNITSPLAIYDVYDSVPSNSYDFSYEVDTEYAAYFAATPTNFNDLSIALGSGTQTLYFPITVTLGYNDVTATIIPTGQPTAGFNYTNKIVYKNLGVAPNSGTITFTKDPLLTINSVAQTGAVMTPTGFTYDFTNLGAYETRSFNVSMSVPSIPVVNINDELTNEVLISAPANDINTENNTFVNTQIVVASYDPNDKMEAHGEKIDFNQFSQEDYLFYTIRFQNTGTANAVNIRIEDLLDAQLDEESIRMVSASHNYVMERIGNQVIWRFDFIYLPSQLANEELSNGYLTFKIKVKPGFEVGDIIPNFAEIYFDTNPPIITNTFMSEFEEQLGTKEFGVNNIVVYPNPSKTIVNVDMVQSNEILESVQLIDVLGKSVWSRQNIHTSKTAIDVSQLSIGIYLIEVTTANNLRIVKKLVIN